MKIIFLNLLLFIYSAIASTPSLEDFALVIKPGITNYNDSFALKVENFKDMIIQNKIFVDNSLFIKEAMEWYQWMGMTGPRKCGKTINLDMLKTFLEIQVDDRGNRILPKNTTVNYKLFVNGEITLDDGTVPQKLKTPLLISQHKEIIDLFLGEYPVIYVNFKNVRGNTSREIKHNVGLALKQAFVQHKYMLNVFRNSIKNYTVDDPLDAFEYILNNEADEISFDCIPFLCEILYNHFNRKTVIIYDDYDKPLTNILQLDDFPKADVMEIIRIMDNLTLWSFRENKFIRKTFIMTTFELYRHPFAPWVGYSRLDLVLGYKESISRYFGFNRKIVERLFETYELPEQLREQAHRWYEGFQAERYNPFSIVSFLNTKLLSNYFVDMEVEKIAGPILSRSFKARKKILKLLSNGTIRSNVQEGQRKFSESEIFVLKSHKFGAKTRPGREQWSSPEREEWIVFAWYLIRKGYFSPFVLRKNEIIDNVVDNKVDYRIPNREIATLMCTRMIKYYQNLYKITYKSLLDAASSLFIFVANEIPYANVLEDSLAVVYRETSQFLVPEDDNLNATIDNPYRAIFTCVLLKMQQLADFELEVSYRRFRNPDYVIYNRRCDEAYILQIIHDNQTLRNTFDEVNGRQSSTLQRYNRTRTVKTAVLKIWPDRRVEVYPKQDPVSRQSSDVNEYDVSKFT